MLEHPNNFDNLIKLFSNLHLVKFINISAKSFFSCEWYAIFSFNYKSEAINTYNY